jgi:pimeloyl-ACP methyl ester carboxylesterase
MTARKAWAILLCAGALLTACGGTPVNQIDLMPAPEVYEEGQFDPFIDNDPIARGVEPGVLYATDRAPADPDARKNEYYGDQRGYAVRLGVANIELDWESDITWEEAKRVSLLKDRSGKYPLSVSTIREFGALHRTVRPFEDDLEPDPEPARLFAEEIDRRLATSTGKDVYIYVHGYKVTFQNPILVAAELWHFLGYQGAFIAYSWPSTPRTFAYTSDLEDAANSGRGLRALILEIAASTEAESIHVIGYSAGTRVVTRALADLGLLGYFLDEQDIEQRTRLGNVILIGSDVDRGILAGQLLDGALRIPKSLTIYQSPTDKALGMSRFLFRKERAGQLIERDVSEREAQFWRDHPGLHLIDVGNAEGSDSGNGHSYFRSSSWVSSDILMTLMYGLAPAERGLVRDAGGMRLWRFPDDYISRLRQALLAADSEQTVDNQ